jgi:hypothetical protein
VDTSNEPLGVVGEAKIANHELAFVRNMGGHSAEFVPFSAK